MQGDYIAVASGLPQVRILKQKVVEYLDSLSEPQRVKGVAVDRHESRFHGYQE